MSEPIFTPSAPPFTTLVQPQGGFGLRTKKLEVARAKIEKLLACGDGARVLGTTMHVIERAPAELVAKLFGELAPNVASSGRSFTQDELAASVVGHDRDDAIALDAWASFGVPEGVDVVRESLRDDRGRSLPGPLYLRWRWSAEGDATFERWYAFARTHADPDMVSPWGRVELRPRWRFRLRMLDGTVVDEPYPASQVHGIFGGYRCAAYLYLVLPLGELTPRFTDEYNALVRASGLPMSVKQFRLCLPNRRGDGRDYRRLF